MARLPVILSFVVAATLLAAGCTPAGVAVGAGAATANASQKEGGLPQALIDVRIRTEINHYLFQKDVDLFSAVSLSVGEGRVLLTGAVTKPETRIEAARLAWQAEGVREVINEIQVTDESSLIDKARDSWITAQVRQKLLFDQDVRSINFSIDTVNGVVYLFGVAQSAVESDRVVNHARNVRYVRNVVSYLRDKTVPVGAS